MKKITYKDWLDGNNVIDKARFYMELLHGNKLSKVIFSMDDLEEMFHKYNAISEKDLKKIRQHQEKAFDIAVLLFKDNLINRFKKRINNIDKKLVAKEIHGEIDFFREELLLKPVSKFNTKQEKYIRNQVCLCKEGEKGYKNINGNDYKEAIKQNDNYIVQKPYKTVKVSGGLYDIKAKLEYLNYLEGLQLNYNGNKRGLASLYSDNIPKLKAIHKLATKFNFINCLEEDFIAAFTSKPLPLEFRKIKWLIETDTGRSKGTAHKGALREFVAMAMYEDYKAKDVPRDVSHLFVDKEGKGLKLSSPKDKDIFSSHFDKIEKIFRAIPINV